VELVSVESTVTALFPERPDGDAHSCEHRALPEQRRRSAGDPGSRALEQSDLESVIVDLERRFGLPLLLEALQCRTPSDLAALVRTQLTSGA
jgi:hypothetical protein